MITAEEPVLRSLSAGELRRKYLDFFKSKGHTIIPSASLIPENDPTTLFTGSGMQPMISYLLGEKHPLGARLADSQKCFRSQDMEEVGDNRHTTFFEMLGNWSLGDYFKKEQIAWMFEFLTKEINLDPNRIYITVFRGNEELNLLRDTEAVEIWQKEFAKIGIDAKAVDFSERDGMQDGRIFYYDEKKNWWSRAGVPANMPVGEPGGPDSEMFWDFGADLNLHENSKWKDQPCHVNCDCGRFMEIGNNVFMQYVKTEQGFELLKNGNIDFGGGLERMTAANNNTPDIFKTDLFLPIINKIEKLSAMKYSDKSESKYTADGKQYLVDVRKQFRRITDHTKSSVFLIADGVEPSNIGRGYVLRRLLRRVIRYGKQINIKGSFIHEIAETIIDMYKNIYPELEKNKNLIFNHLQQEEEKFKKPFDNIKEYHIDLEQAVKYGIIKKIKDIPILSSKNIASGRYVYENFQSYGAPTDSSKEIIEEMGLEFDQKEYDEAFRQHQELSRAASAGMFKGGLADSGEMSVKYHTATHLLLAALREIINPEIYQKGSNITAERLRFDFNYPQKLTEEQIKKVEDLVNQKIQEKIPVEMVEMPKEEALKIAKVSFDPAKYGDAVKVYKIGDYSIELCGGPHVGNTGDLGHFKIQKEESSSAGVRRIKAVLE